MIQVVFSVRANKEIFESFLYYDTRQTGLGDKFLNELTKKVDQIKSSPGRCTSNRLPFRECQMKKFPFFIIYRYNPEKKYIFISSVFHSSRNPNKKYR